MTILSIDPAFSKPMAYAVFNEQGKCFNYDTIEKLDLSSVLDCKLVVPDISIIVTENPYPCGRIRQYSSKGYSETFKKLCFAVGMIIQFANSIGAEYRLIRPVDWKRYWSLTKKTPADLQKRIREEITGVDDDEDIQDAILIGKYYIEYVMVGEGM